LIDSSDRRKELAEGKTSKVALDDCNLPSSLRVAGCLSATGASWLPAGDERVFKGTINSFVVVVAGRQRNDRAGFRSL